MLDNILMQYKNLTEEEQKMLLVYKSRLFYIINEVTRVPGFEEMDNSEILKYIDSIKCDKVLKKYQYYLSLKENLFIRMSLFNDITTLTLEEFIGKVKTIVNTLKETSGKMIIGYDTVVYRGVACERGKVDLVGNSSFISADLRLENTYPFLDNKGEEKHIFEIHLDKNTNILACPYSIIVTYKDEENAINYRLNKIEPTVLKIIKVNEMNQSEIIILGDDIEFRKLEVNKLENGIFYHKVEGNIKHKEK